MFTNPRAGIVAFLWLCDGYINGMAKANAKSLATYRSNFANPAVTKVHQGKIVLDVARMDADASWPGTVPRGPGSPLRVPAVA
jgi:hypothetical protein